MRTSQSDPQLEHPIGIPITGIPARPPPRTTYQDLQPPATVPWSTGIRDCFPDHFDRYCISFWFPWYTFGQISEIVDRGSSSCLVNGAMYFLLAWVTGCACFYSMAYRTKMRKQFALEGNLCQDCILHCLCQASALSQEYRELKNRGYNLSLGWTGNEGRQDHGVAMAPVIERGMRRDI